MVSRASALPQKRLRRRLVRHGRRRRRQRLRRRIERQFRVDQRRRSGRTKFRRQVFRQHDVMSFRTPYYADMGWTKKPHDRIYTVTCSDSAGNASTASADVTVPKESGTTSPAAGKRRSVRR
jgi:hypothetical protein